jgi:methylmalonyl-CoA mutase N-terminal domain/subunit
LSTVSTLRGLLAIVILVAAGCGGSSDKKANEEYATSVCTAIGSWEQQIKSIATTFSGGVSKATLQSKVTQAQAATSALMTQITRVPPPDTSEGKAAKQQLQQLTTDINTATSSAKTAVAELPPDPSMTVIASTVAVIAPQVQNLAAQTKSAINALQDAGGSLSSAFKDADACQSLGGS